MQWQDVVFLIGQMIFNISLIPSILSKDKPALATSLITTIVIFVYVFVFSTLSLWVSSMAVASTGFMWSILAYQKWKEKRR